MKLIGFVDKETIKVFEGLNNKYPKCPFCDCEEANIDGQKYTILANTKGVYTMDCRKCRAYFELKHEQFKRKPEDKEWEKKWIASCGITIDNFTFRYSTKYPWSVLLTARVKDTNDYSSWSSVFYTQETKKVWTKFGRLEDWLIPKNELNKKILKYFILM